MKKILQSVELQMAVFPPIKPTNPYRPYRRNPVRSFDIEYIKEAFMGYLYCVIISLYNVENAIVVMNLNAGGLVL